MEARPETPSETLADYVIVLEASTLETAAIFGLSGLRIGVTPGEGWSSVKTANGVLLNIDPLQVAHKPDADAVDKHDTAAIVEAIAQTDRRYTSFAICHELGHVRDFIDPEHQAEDSVTKSDHFFWNIVDDAVINVRLRNVPVLDACADELFRDILFPNSDFLAQAKHTQLMFGLLLHTVTGDTPPVSDDVQQIIDNLKTVPAAGAIFNIMQVLADPSTSLRERRLIAKQYIKPAYDALLQEDQQHNPEGSSDDVYAAYEHVMHGRCGGTDEGNSEDDQAEKTEDHHPGYSPMHTAIQHVSGVLKENNKEQLPVPPPRERQPERAVAHSVIAELGLSQKDAEAYLRDVNTYQAEIRAVAKAFGELAIPGVDTMSPRYGYRARYTGPRLHPRRLAQAAIQLQTGQERPIWRPVELRGRTQSFNLEKFDVHLLVDVSASMLGLSAEHAGVAALMLMEGLELTRRTLSKQHSRTSRPDIRLQIVSFGVYTEVTVPLTNTPTPGQRGRTFAALKNPRATGTFVADAFLGIKEAASQHPDRTHLAFIISDGSFDDHDISERIVDELPKRNVHMAQFIIGSSSIPSITKDASYLENPRLVPKAVREQLQKYMRRTGTI